MGARDLGECLRLQLLAMAADTPGRDAAIAITEGPLERLPKIGIDGVCKDINSNRDTAEAAVQYASSVCSTRSLATCR